VNLKKIKAVLLYTGLFFVVLCTMMGIASPYVNPAIYWPIAICGLLFPFTFLINTIGLIIASWYKHHLGWLFLVLILFGIPNLSRTIAFTPSKPSGPSTNDDSISVLSWNVGIMNFSAPDSGTAARENNNIFEAIKNADADVVCLQEFFTAMAPGDRYNLLDVLSGKMGYPHYYFSKDIPYFSGLFFSGSVIFSKHPIVDTSNIRFDDGSGGGVIKATIQKGPIRISIFNSRLQSVYFDKQDYASIGMQNKEKSLLQGFTSIIGKLKNGFQQRSTQASLLDSFVNTTSYPFFICVDLNDTPTGNVYRTIRNNHKDVWQSCGMGLGRTFKLFSPTLRIDYIFCSSHFKPAAVRRINSSGSDHLALLGKLYIAKGVE